MKVSDFVEKPLLEKIQDLLERKPGNCDVAFCVGKEKKIVGALKVILKASSPFLEKEFEEKWEVAVVKEGDGIPLPDFDPIAFALFVKLTTLDSWSLEILQAIKPLNQIMNLLFICRSFEMQKPVEILEELAARIMQSFGEYKDTDDFLQLSQTNLKYVLGSDDIGIKELDVFYAAMRWANFQCRQMEVLPTEEKFREVLGDCLFEIRFPIMTCAEFTEARESKDILTGDEIIGIYGLIGLTGNKNRKRLKFDSNKLPFKTTQRNKVQTSESNPNSNNSETLIPPGVSRLCLTRGLESAKNPLIVVDEVDDSPKTQLRPQSLENASSLQLPAAASLMKTICWGKKINGFPPRKEHAAVAVCNSVYSFGGFNFDRNPTYSKDILDVFVLNVNEREKKWKKLAVKNTAVNPNQRWGHSAVVHNEFVIIFGGYVAKVKKLSNLTYRFNTQTMKWDKPKVTGNIPDARQYHTAVVLRKEMVIYCGYGTTNDLHSLDLESYFWSTIETNGIPPSLRRDHSATVHNDRFMLIFGGWDYKEKKRVNTIESFDLNSKTWTAVETCGTPPSGREYHRAFVHNGRMYIFGGTNPSSILNDVFSYDPETFEWEEVIPNGEAPSPREGAACVVLNDQVFIFGGWNRKYYLDNTHVLQM